MTTICATAIMEAFFAMDFTTEEGVLKDAPPSIWGARNSFTAMAF
jgi:hypothetical protein